MAKSDYRGNVKKKRRAKASEDLRNEIEVLEREISERKELLEKILAEEEAEEAKVKEAKAGDEPIQVTGFTGPKKAWSFVDEDGETRLVLSPGVASYYGGETVLVPVWMENGRIDHILTAKEAAQYNW